MIADAQGLRALLADRRESAATAHQSGAGGFSTSLRLTRAVDHALRAAWRLVGEEADRHAAVIALGGYGRSELSPGSDLDVMILCDADEHREEAEGNARGFLHLLWDAGLDLGHSVRTVDEALVQRTESHQVWAGLLESRPVCGSEELTLRFLSRMKESVASGDQSGFVAAVLAELRGRHSRYGNTVKLLDPNIKKSSGSLRDLHVLLWLFRGTDPTYQIPPVEEETATQTHLRLLANAGLLDDETLQHAEEAADFLLRVRHEMHLQHGGLHDTLEYRLQLSVANALGFTDTPDARGVELFMRRYYRHARSIDHLSRRLCRRFQAPVAPAPDIDQVRTIGTLFRVGGGLVSMIPGNDQALTALQVFESFAAVAEYDVEPDAEVSGAIENARGLIESDDQEVAAMFRRILGSGNAGQTFRVMNDLNILGVYIPEFGRLVSFFQHNMYHYYTADEHTVIAVTRAEALAAEQSVLGDVYRRLERKDYLVMAILLHDIAKPVSVEGHEKLGVGIAETVLARIGMSDGFPLISFLIRNHLVMEQVAFRRNIHDPQTIREFASRFRNPEELDYLYVLTYADLSAVNMTVWTDWKASILRNLYLRTSEVLKQQLTGAEIDRFHERQVEQAAEQLVSKLSGDLPGEDVRRHLRMIGNDAYVSQFSEQEIASHIREGGDSGNVATLFRQGEGFTDVTVIGTDAPYVLSHCCAVLSANDANIFDANIFTRDDGVFIDHFRVSDRRTGSNLSPELCEKIGADLRRVLEQNLNIGTLFAAHRRRWKRRGVNPVNPATRMGVEFEENPRFTIVEIFAPDSVGFLYRVTETMSGLGLDIHYARIATRIDGVVDAFYVREANGSPVPKGARREEIRRQLVETIREVAAEQFGEEGSGKGQGE